MKKTGRAQQNRRHLINFVLKIKKYINSLVKVKNLPEATNLHRIKIDI